MDISRGNLSMVMVPYRYTLKRIAKGWRSKNVVAMELGFTIFCSVSSDNFFSVIYTFLSLWLLISVTHSCYLKRWNILKKANSLKKGEGVPLLNFEGSPESRVPRSQVPRSWSHFYTMPFSFSQPAIVNFVFTKKCWSE